MKKKTITEVEKNIEHLIIKTADKILDARNTVSITRLKRTIKSYLKTQKKRNRVY